MPLYEKPCVLLHNMGIETTDWLATIGSVYAHRMRLRAPKSAVLVTDNAALLRRPWGKDYLSCTALMTPPGDGW
jgi:hypothetical protein